MKKNVTPLARRAAAALLACVAALAAGCASHIKYQQTIGSPQPGERVRTIAIFLDGTHADAALNSNIKRLHSLATPKNRTDITALYVEGVGVGSDVAGMAVGLGTAARVRLAYAFLLTHYRQGDQVHLFGWSRGAYAARILAALLYHAGLPPLGQAPAAEVAALVYDTVKEKYADEDEPWRRARVQAALRERLPPLTGLHSSAASAPVVVNVLGLWDTVEALGGQGWGGKVLHKLRVRPHVADVGNANPRYGDTLCNVRHAFHAVSIDDNREWVFTPLLLTRDHLLRACEPIAGTLSDAAHYHPRHLQEVWFAGSHRDIGGGHSDSLLGGTSLQWMIERLDRAGAGVLPAPASARHDVHGTSHDPEAGGWAPLYHAINRDLAGYALSPRAMAGYERRLCVHDSVFARRAAAHPRARENHQLRLQQPGAACLVPVAAPAYDEAGRMEEDRSRPAGQCEPSQPRIQIAAHTDCQ